MIFGPPKPLDLVNTPLGSFFVVNYVDRNPVGLNTSERLVIPCVENYESQDEFLDLVDTLKEKFPGLFVNGFHQDFNFRIDTLNFSAGTLSELLNAEHYNKQTLEYITDIDDPHKFADALNKITRAIKLSVFDQLVRDLSTYDLTVPERYGEIHFAKDSTSFIYIDSGIRSGSGRGSGRLHYYTLGKTLDRRGDDNFYCETVEVTELFETAFKYLSAGDLPKLQQHPRKDLFVGTVDGCPAVMVIPDLTSVGLDSITKQLAQFSQ